MPQPLAAIQHEDFSGKLKNAIAAWRGRHDVPSIEGELDTSWRLSQIGHCDDFAQALGQNLDQLGIPHKLCIISRVTKDEDGEIVDHNPFSHAFVSIPCEGAEINVDSMGIGADLAFVDAWQDEDGQETEFEYSDFDSIDAMRTYLRTHIEVHGAPRSSPENDQLVAAWSASLTEAILAAGIEPAAAASPEDDPIDDEADSSPSIQVYIKVSGDPTDDEDEDVPGWYCVDVELSKPIDATSDISEGLMHCLHERALDAFHDGIAIGNLDDFVITVHLDDGRALEAVEPLSPDESEDQAGMPWDLVLNSKGSVYSVSIDEVPVEVEVAAELGNDDCDSDYLVELIGDNPEIIIPGDWGYSALHHAAQAGNVAVIKALSDAGADINELNHQGLTPLHLATRAENAVDVLKVLIELGADMHKPSEQGFNAAQYGMANLGGRQASLWLIAKGSAPRADESGMHNGIYIDPAIEDLMELSEPENTITFKNLTPKVAAVVGGFIPEVMDLLDREPKAATEIDEHDSLRRIAKKTGNADMSAALDAQRSFQSIREIAGSVGAIKKNRQNRP